MEPAIQFDRQKLLDVIHYICSKRSSDEIGKVKLHKILYFSDMLHFIKTDRALTGVTYQKQPFGPVAKHLSWALKELERTGRLRVGETLHHGFLKLHVEVLKQAPKLSADETGLLDEVADFVCAKTAKAISELSHNAAWDAADLGAEIPYESAFGMIPTEITDEDLEWGELEARRIPSAA